jgi:hypothetical protein
MKEPVLRQLRFGALGDPQDVLTRRREMGQSTPPCHVCDERGKISF